jgi:hypothetical protein
MVAYRTIRYPARHGDTGDCHRSANQREHKAHGIHLPARHDASKCTSLVMAKGSFRSGVGGGTGVRDCCVAILAKHAACFRVGDDRLCRSHASRRQRAGRDASGCRGPCGSLLKSLRTCQRDAGYRAEARSCILEQYVGGSGDGAWKSSSIGTASWVLHYPCHGPMETTES